MVVASRLPYQSWKNLYNFRIIGVRFQVQIENKNNVDTRLLVVGGRATKLRDEAVKLVA